ncbi:major facilitator superfamily domain-containing protein 10-like isoform X1 [Scylla paramamosain]|uniref:major facilitator superfamily domain-containing protein 10-like isoform X1 n=1 Tax=Scylla paramamosain TaxID=85552 RepID=UPI003082B171
MATLRSCKQVGGSDGGGGGSGGEVEGRDRGAVQAADIKEKKNTRTSKVVFGSLILDLLGFMVVLPLSPALLDYYSKHDSSGLYSSLLSSVTYYQHIISIPARFHSVLFGGTDWHGIQRRLHHQANCRDRVLPLGKYWVVLGLSCLHTHSRCG